MHTEDLHQEDLTEDVELLATEDLDDDDDDEESWDEVSELDDDDDDDEALETAEDAEDTEAEFILPLLAGTVAPTVVRGISRLFRPRRPRRYRHFRHIPGRGRGVRGAVIRTPRGVARVRLPRSVVPMSLYRRDMARLTQRDNRLVARINRTQKDLARTDRKATRALALATTANSGVTRLKKAQAKLEARQRSAATTSLLMSLMQVQGLDQRLREHVHDQVGAPPRDLPPADNTLLMLPLLMGGTGKGEDSTLMLAMMMMMANPR